MIRRPPRSTLSSSSAASDVYKRQECTLATAIDELEWKTNREGTRRVQMYGPHHDSRYRVSKGAPVTKLPACVMGLLERAIEIGTIAFPDHLYLYQLGNHGLTELFVNEYTPQDELQFHRDHNVTYEEVIVGISLLQPSVLRFREMPPGKEEIPVELPACSCYFMSGASRVEYQHGMLQGDCLGERRVSLTFRVVSESNLLEK
eukprot:TRINITY_DN60899_c0_g1_i2.p1 TRINITY_DN60899_c0_g1~~TRINITY_DN60899_c0_g1_i2.p1  ORF type:complete len:203 (+),score=48.52 TRINITY_DN60899_c0_g1_i2:108-716(+)